MGQATHSSSFSVHPPAGDSYPCNSHHKSCMQAAADYCAILSPTRNNNVRVSRMA